MLKNWDYVKTTFKHRKKNFNRLGISIKLVSNDNNRRYKLNINDNANTWLALGKVVLLEIDVNKIIQSRVFVLS